MDIKVTLVGVIILLVVFLPIIYMIVIASGNTKKAKKQFIEISKSKGATPAVVEVLGNTILGLDNTSKTVMYADKKNIGNSYCNVDLSTLKNVLATTQRNNDKSLLYVGLELVGTSEKFEIPFYNDDSDEDLSRDAEVCYQDAKRWENTLRPLLES